jgi:Flp pilus assembly pilin Flp
MQTKAPFFRLRNLDDGGVTGLISHKMLEPVPEESAVKAEKRDLDDFEGREVWKMESATKMFIRARESVVRGLSGQTMTEYALIIAAVGVVAWGAYNVMGQDIGSMASGIDSDLTSA